MANASAGSVAPRSGRIGLSSRSPWRALGTVSRLTTSRPSRPSRPRRPRRPRRPSRPFRLRGPRRRSRRRSRRPRKKRTQRTRLPCSDSQSRSQIQKTIPMMGQRSRFQRPDAGARSRPLSQRCSLSWWLQEEPRSTSLGASTSRGPVKLRLSRFLAACALSPRPLTVLRRFTTSFASSGRWIRLAMR